ncbi:hypothetical protein D0S48_18255 [Psychrobacillus sp. AK 1817]|uniref:hypothetical protein n=1 Tax=Psychrobacillus sp. AK 1817 TaxID=2303505 RepID=UPI001247B662|nr:hypothetical protein [Psychrobacillus sp. AK 1817]QEY22442.1 hypothetical protein D0S48_18255 [Psychrobacillus sp. AK 1817]
MKYNLLVDTYTSQLEGITNPYFSYDGPEELNVEGGIGRASQRNFYLNHPESDTFVNKMGYENTFYLHRLFLSYYEAYRKVENFWNDYACPSVLNLQADIVIANIEQTAKQYSIDAYDTYTLSYANYLTNGREKKFMQVNYFQEYLWAINMNEFITKHNISPFPDIKIESHSIFHSSYIIKSALSKKEVSIALYEWASINNFNQPDFIKRISNILELIKKDLERNKPLYNQIKNGTDVRDNVYLLNNRIQNKWRSFFFGVFNASELLGAYSRHAELEIKDIKGFNKEDDLTAEEIVKMWRKKALLPSNSQFEHLFRVWYIATSILLLNWLRLNHINPNTENASNNSYGT